MKKKLESNNKKIINQKSMLMKSQVQVFSDDLTKEQKITQMMMRFQLNLNLQKKVKTNQFKKTNHRLTKVMKIIHILTLITLLETTREVTHS